MYWYVTDTELHGDYVEADTEDDAIVIYKHGDELTEIEGCRECDDDELREIAAGTIKPKK